jgi:hypothetical protein
MSSNATASASSAPLSGLADDEVNAAFEVDCEETPPPLLPPSPPPPEREVLRSVQQKQRRPRIRALSALFVAISILNTLASTLLPNIQVATGPSKGNSPPCLGAPRIVPSVGKL